MNNENLLTKSEIDYISRLIFNSTVFDLDHYDHNIYNILEKLADMKKTAQDDYPIG